MEGVKIGNFTYSQDLNNNWIFKADRLTPFKKNGGLKKEYKDLPRFKVIVEYEEEQISEFKTLLSEGIQDISLKLLSFIKQQ